MPRVAWGDVADSRRLAMALLRLRTFLYGSVAVLMFVASVAENLERLVALGAFTLAILAPLMAARTDAVRRLQYSVVADLAGAFVIWWSLQQAPVVALLLVLWAVAVTALLPDARVSRLLLLLAVVLEIAKLPISVLQRAGWFPWTPSGSEVAEPFTLVVSAGGETVIVVVVAVVFRSLSSAQRAAAQRAAASDQQFTAVFHSPIVALALVSEDGMVTEVNEAAAELVGKTHDEIVGMAWWDVCGVERTEEFARFAAAVRGQGARRLRRELPFALADRTVWVAAAVCHLPGDDRQPPRFLVHLEDITERRNAEEALRRSEEQYRSFFERLPVAMYRTTPEGAILDGNAALVELLGYTDVAELRRANAYDLYVEAAERDHLNGRIDRDGYAVGFEYQLCRRDGSRIWVRDTTRRVDDAAGRHYEGALVDVTERRNAECELSNRARQQEAAALLGRLALETADIRVVAERCARVVDDILDMTATHVVGSGPAGAVTLATTGDPEAEGEVRRCVDALLDAARPADAGPVTSAAGVCAVPIPGADAVRGALAAQCDPTRGLDDDDVTFLNTVAGVLGAAIERSLAQERLEQLVASKDEFIASISHEVRTPLTVVVGMADELKHGWRRFDDAEIAELIAMLVDQSREMQDLVEDLLVAARADIGKVPVHMQEVDLGEEIAHVLGSLSAPAQHVTTPTGVHDHVYADPVRLRQILRNLLTNAIRYGGERVGIEIAPAETTVAVRVVDDGSGIPPEERDRVFLPYERAHETVGQPGSVGLGLTVARKLAELMGGRLAYRYDGKSVFELTLVKAVEIAPASLS